MKPFSLILTLIFSFSSYSQIKKFDVVQYKRKLFTYQEVCKSMASKHMLLVTSINPSKLDCMGKPVAAKEFCLQKVEKKNFLRGYVNQKMEEVVCEYGIRAVVSIACDKKHKKFCLKPKFGCQNLGKFYAQSLELDHYAHLEKDIDDVLNCYFSRKKVAHKEIINRPTREWEEQPIIDRDLFGKLSGKNKKSNIQEL